MKKIITETERHTKGGCRWLNRRQTDKNSKRGREKNGDGRKKEGAKGYRAGREKKVTWRRREKTLRKNKETRGRGEKMKSEEREKKKEQGHPGTEQEGRGTNRRGLACRRSCMAVVINRRMIASAPLVKYSQDMIGLITGDYRTLITDTPLLLPHTTGLHRPPCWNSFRTQCHMPPLLSSFPRRVWRVVEGRSFMPRFSLQCEGVARRGGGQGALGDG